MHGCRHGSRGARDDRPLPRAAASRTAVPAGARTTALAFSDRRSGLAEACDHRPLSAGTSIFAAGPQVSDHLSASTSSACDVLRQSAVALTVAAVVCLALYRRGRARRAALLPSRPRRRGTANLVLCCHSTVPAPRSHCPGTSTTYSFPSGHARSRPLPTARFAYLGVGLRLPDPGRSRLRIVGSPNGDDRRWAASPAFYRQSVPGSTSSARRTQVVVRLPWPSALAEVHGDPFPFASCSRRPGAP